MRRRAANAQQSLTQQQAKTQLVAYLYGCRAEMLTAITVGQLCRTYRVDERTAEYELTIARQKRGAAA